MQQELVLQNEGFDYTSLDADTALFMEEKANQINERGRRMIWENGRDFADVQEKLADYHNGTFLKWVETETPYSEKSVYNCIAVFKNFSFVKITELDFSITALYQLSAKSTPQEARDDAISRAEKGEKITPKIAKEIIGNYNGKSKIEQHKPKPFITLTEWDNMSVRERQDIVTLEGNKTLNKTNDNIEWARWSWNPVTGCLHNCAYCYARDIANRFYVELPETERFNPVFYPERLTAPHNTNQPDLNMFDDPVDAMGHRNIFVCSMADLFGKWVPQEWIESVLSAIQDNPQWTFLLLTKFPVRMAEFTYPPNVWLGTSVDYQWAVERAEKAFVKIAQSGFKGITWLSCEPMMERLTFNSLEMFDWVVMGGASKSTQTSEYKPPFDDIVHLHNQARDAGCRIYQKTNLLPGISDNQRIREYPE